MEYLGEWRCFDGGKDGRYSGWATLVTLRRDYRAQSGHKVFGLKNKFPRVNQLNGTTFVVRYVPKRLGMF